jgi:hypothetical protein
MYVMHVWSLLRLGTSAWCPTTCVAYRNAQVLRLSHNKLATLPPEIGQLEGLEVLAADHNLLTTVPGE